MASEVHLRLFLGAALLLVLNFGGPIRAMSGDLPRGIVSAPPNSGPYVRTPQGCMVPYQAKIPTTDAEFTMVPVPGGRFKLGSPATESGRGTEEGPQVEIEIKPFWIGAYEVGWGEFNEYTQMGSVFRHFKQQKILPITEQNKIDVVTAPSSVYEPKIPYQFGNEARRPAITISQYSAKQYTKWLSGLTQEFYRLPSEAEWEYACRAGTSTAYSFGDDPRQLGEYAWYQANSEESTHLVGQKKPNPWGLYDMHGNVAEWVLDGFAADAYEELARQKNSADNQPMPAREAIRWGTKLFPRVIRGGSWDDSVSRVRSAARIPSQDDEWKLHDPDFPQSPWWFTNGYGLAVGFRIVRPLDTPERSQRERYWQPEVDSIRSDVDERIDNEGRGQRGVSNAQFLDELRNWKQSKAQRSGGK